MSDPHPIEPRSRDAAELPPEEQLRRLAELGQLTAEAVHDIRNPLAAILGLAEILDRQGPAADRAEIAGRLKDNARHCRAIVDDLLSVASGVRPKLQSIAVGPLAERIMARRSDLSRGLSREPQPDPHHDQDRLGRGGIALNWQGPPDGDLALRADATSLERILENLISNAEAVLAENGGGTILFGVEADQEPGLFRVFVQDDGPGVPEQIQSRLFEPFTTMRRGGTGLGLAACRRLAEGMDCEISHESPAEGGARFVLRGPGEQTRVREPRSSASEESGRGGESLRILIVDDDRNALETYERLLTLEGHDVEATTEGRQGLARFLQEDFDVALVDIRIPDLPGPRFHAEVMQRTPERAGRLVFATGDCHNPQTRSFLDATGNPYLVKPFEIEELRGALALARRNTGQAEDPPS